MNLPAKLEPSKLYRYAYYRMRPGQVHLYCDEYKVIKKTPTGIWVQDYWSKNNKRWVSLSSTKRFAYPTKAEALDNLIKRTEKHLSFLEARKLTASKALSIARNLKDNPSKRKDPSNENSIFPLHNI